MWKLSWVPIDISINKKLKISWMLNATLSKFVPIFLFNFLWFLFLHQKVIGTMVQIKIKENLSYLNFCFPTLKFAVNAFMHTPACGSSSITTIGPWFFWRRSFRSLWFIFTLKNDKLMIRPIRYFFLVLYIFHHVQCLAKHSVFLPFMKQNGFPKDWNIVP